MPLSTAGSVFSSCGDLRVWCRSNTITGKGVCCYISILLGHLITKIRSCNVILVMKSFYLCRVICVWVRFVFSSPAHAFIVWLPSQLCSVLITAAKYSSDHKISTTSRSHYSIVR